MLVNVVTFHILVQKLDERWDHRFVWVRTIGILYHTSFQWEDVIL